MVTIRLFGVFPVLGVTESQVRPIGLVVAVALKGSTVAESVLVTEIVWLLTVPVASAVMFMELVLTLRSAVLLTFNVTGITCAGEFELGTVKVTCPVQTCGLVRPLTPTETSTWLWS